MQLSRRDLDNSWLFAPNKRLEGTRLATVRLRPVRAALLVPDTDTKAAAAAVESCCLSWGGFANLIVPYSNTEGIREPWRKIIEVIDPDLFVCFEDEPPDEVERCLRGKGNRRVFSHGSYQHETLVTGTLVYSAVDAFFDPQDIERKRYSLVLPLYRGSPEKLLPFLARYGSMIEPTGPQGEKIVKTLPKLDLERLFATHRDFFDVRECQAFDHKHHEIPKIISEVFIGNVARLMPGDEGARYLTLPHLTLTGLISMPSSASRHLEPLSKARKYDSRVVVLGDYTSVEDLALFWALRGQRSGEYPFPIWLPYRHVRDDRVKDLIESASRKLVRRGRGGGERLHITSASLSLGYLEDRFRKMFPAADITTDIADFIGSTSEHVVVEERQSIFFRGGTAYAQRIRLPQMERFDPDNEHVVHEVEVEGVKLPAVEAVEKTVYGPARRGNSILTTKGAIRSVDPHRSIFDAKDFLEISMPDGWGLLKAFFEDYGYECTRSDKSPALLRQITLLGGVEGISVVANSRVFETLKTLSIRKGSKKEAGQEEKEQLYLADRRVEPYNFFTDPKERFLQKHAEVILRWLVEKRILLRGANIRCPQCWLELWYPVDRIGERWTCDGCREEMPIPIKHSSLSWLYRISELWAQHGHQQGYIAPLLALYVMHVKWGASFAREGFGYYPGVVLRKRDKASVPVDHIELDLVALWGGRPVLVECKVSAERFADSSTTKDFPENLARQVKLAEHINARKVIVASPSPFPDDTSNLTYHVPEGNTVEIEWWDKEALLDPIYLGENLKVKDAETTHLEGLGNWLTEYYSGR